MIGRLRISAALRGTVAILAALVFSGCGERSPTESELQAGGLRVGEVARAVLLPLPSAGKAYSTVIDQSGGSLHFGIGSITFPPNSLDGPRVIRASVDGRSLAVTFSPHGLVFPRSASPMLEWQFGQAVTSIAAVQIAYVDSNWRVLEILPTTVDPARRTAVAPLSHFSTYVMGAH